MGVMKTWTRSTCRSRKNYDGNRLELGGIQKEEEEEAKDSLNLRVVAPGEVHIIALLQKGS